MVDGATLEMLCTATYRRFESCPLRQNLKIPHFMRDFCVLAERTEMKGFLVVRVSALPTYAEAHTLAWETALSCPIVTKKLCRISLSRILCGIFCVLAERTELKGFLAVRVSALPTYAEGPALAWETALSCPIVTKKLCRISLSRILCGIFCILAERTELKGFLVVRVSEGCLRPEKIRRGSGRKQKTRLRAVSRKPRVSLCV